MPQTPQLRPHPPCAGPGRSIVILLRVHIASLAEVVVSGHHGPRVLAPLGWVRFGRNRVGSKPSEVISPRSFKRPISNSTPSQPSYPPTALLRPNGILTNKHWEDHGVICKELSSAYIEMPMTLRVQVIECSAKGTEQRSA
eukprot:2526704-Pleurochrysis_carterae.AAC.3